MQRPTLLATAALIAAGLLLSSCGGGGGGGKRLPTISGAGASFPAAAYQRWGQEYAAETGNQVNYQSVGSGAGVRQFLAGSVDFGATDEALSAEDFKKGAAGERGGDRFADRGARGNAREGRDFREERGPRLGDAAFRAQREAMERAEMSLRKLAAQAHGETLTRLMSAWQDRQADALPSAQELGRAINAATRQAWAQAISQAAKAPASTALLRLEMAAEVPTPADKLSERRMLQLQLLTQRNQPGPSETWGQDVAQVLSGPHEEATARRLQNVLKSLLRS